MLTEYLNREVEVLVDRPLGSRHPEHPQMIYPLNYGYLPHTKSGDGEEIDAYIIGEFFPLKSYRGIAVAVIHRMDDVEGKLVVAPKAGRYSREQIAALVEFQERFFHSRVILPEDKPFFMD